jgi:hypothetical protein
MPGWVRTPPPAKEGVGGTRDEKGERRASHGARASGWGATTWDGVRSVTEPCVASGRVSQEGARRRGN